MRRTQEELMEVRECALRLMNEQWGNFNMVDEGSCVSGNGIVIEYLPKGKRKVRTAFVLMNGDFGFQTEQKSFLMNIMERLQELYPDEKFHYRWGTMD